MAATEVIIYFIGLTVFSSQVPNDAGWKAILPRVEYHDPSAALHTTGTHQFKVAPPAGEVRQEVIARRTATPAGAVAISAPQSRNSPAIQVLKPQPHVEDHAAALIFPRTEYLASPGWGTPKSLPTNSPTGIAYDYIELKGDFVRFDTDQPANSLPFDTSQLVLPPIKTTLCPTIGNLRREYAPPYRGATAVFDLAAEGTLSSCSTGQRVDSRLVLWTTRNYFVISASTMTTTKELYLKPGAGGKVHLYVGHVPKQYYHGNYQQSAGTLSHAHAYYAMGQNGSSCPKTLQSWSNNRPSCGTSLPMALKIRQPAGNGEASEQPRPVPIPGDIPPANGPLNNSMGMTFDCSNTSWP